jgi:hypothetical protein
VKHVWPTLDAAIATLSDPAAGLPARVAAFNGEPGHGVQLVAPDADRYFRGGNDVLSDGSFPAVEVHIASGSIGPFAVGRVEADVDDRVIVVIWAEGEKGEIPDLYEQIVGLGRCALELLIPAHAFGPGVEIANETGAVTYDYSIVPGDPVNEESRDFDRWRTAAMLSFKVEDVTPLP